MIKKLLSIVILLPIAIVLIVLSVANRKPVTMSFDPINIENPIFAITQPLFVLMFAALVVGILLGSFLTWLRQGRYRKSLRQEKSELARTKDEVENLKNQTGVVSRPEIAPGLPMVPHRK